MPDGRAESGGAAPAGAAQAEAERRDRGQAAATATTVREGAGRHAPMSADRPAGVESRIASYCAGNEPLPATPAWRLGRPARDRRRRRDRRSPDRPVRRSASGPAPRTGSYIAEQDADRGAEHRGRAGHVDPDQERRHAVEVLRVAERALRHEQAEQQADAAAYRGCRGPRAHEHHEQEQRRAPRKIITVVPWIRATSGIARSRRVAIETLAAFPASPECGTGAGDDGAGHEHDATRAAPAGDPSQSVPGGTAGRLRVPSGMPARRYSTIASASSTAERRKWPITNGGSSSFCDDERAEQRLRDHAEHEPDREPDEVAPARQCARASRAPRR